MRLRLCYFVALIALIAHGRPAAAQTASYTGSYSQNFDTLANTGTTNTLLPTGWAFVETGSDADATYAASGPLASNTGNTYSFGAGTERALGTLNRGNFLKSTIGVQVQNNTGGTLSGFLVNYVGEQWRRGNASSGDVFDFQYSLNATSVNDLAATWVDVNALDFTAPVTSGSGDPLDGNLAANRRAISGTITGLSLANGGTIWLRWFDFNSTGQEDALAIDDFSLSPVPEPGTVLAVAAGALGVGGFVRRRVRRAV